LPECEQNLDLEILSQQFYNPTTSDFETNYYLAVSEDNKNLPCDTPCGPDYKLIVDGLRSNYWCKN